MALGGLNNNQVMIVAGTTVLGGLVGYFVANQILTGRGNSPLLGILGAVLSAAVTYFYYVSHNIVASGSLKKESNTSPKGVITFFDPSQF